jgi:hypothetical protein
VLAERGGNRSPPTLVSRGSPLSLRRELQDGTSHVKLIFDYDFEPIPEPATLALVGLCLLSVAGIARRRRS